RSALYLRRNEPRFGNYCIFCSAQKCLICLLKGMASLDLGSLNLLKTEDKFSGFLESSVSDGRSISIVAKYPNHDDREKYERCSDARPCKLQKEVQEGF